MSMLSNLELLRRVPLFAALTPVQAESIADAIVKKRFKRGEVVVGQGKKSDALYIILTGRARVLSKDERGREVILATLQPGDYIGEMSLIDDEPHSATVSTEVQTDVLMLGRAAFSRCLPESASMSHNIMRGLVQRLRQADRKIESLALMDVYGRVARALMELAVDEGDGTGTLRVREKISRQDLGKMVGASREMVSRVLRDLEARGFVLPQPDGSMVVKERLMLDV
jgi:CRP/FNR family cyclic AMP-dependent transcriptional regulator